MKRNVTHVLAIALAIVGLSFVGCTGPANPALPPAYIGTWTLTTPASYSDQELVIGDGEYRLTAADDSWTVTGSLTGTDTRLNFRSPVLSEDSVQQSQQRLDIMIAAGEIPVFLADPAEYPTTYVIDSDTMIITVVHDVSEWTYGLTR